MLLDIQMLLDLDIQVLISIPREIGEANFEHDLILIQNMTHQHIETYSDTLLYIHS